VHRVNIHLWGTRFNVQYSGKYATKLQVVMVVMVAEVI